MSESQRVHTRFRVHMKVRYQTAREFLQEYVDNLSKGGLFIRGARGLTPRESVLVEVTLPGYPPFRVSGEVAHVLDPETADRLGREPGVGIEVLDAPSNYERALKSYLRLLGRRRECLVFAEDPEMRAVLREAGYDARAMPPPQDLGDELRSAPKPVLGLLVAEGREYAVAAFAAGLSQRLHEVDEVGALEPLLPLLDAAIPREAASAATDPG